MNTPWVSQRRTTLTIALLTALLGCISVLGLGSPTVTEWLRNDYGLLARHIYSLYTAALLLAALSCAFEPHIRRELQSAGALALIALLTLVGMFALAWQQDPNQAARFFRPLPIYALLLLTGALLLSSVLVLAIPQFHDAPTPRMRRYAWGLLIVLGGALLTLHILSTGRYGRLNDVYDELWAASTMANFARNGAFSPSLGASPYGTPDPAVTRWFLVNGYWARLWGDTSFFTLRSAQTFTGLVLAALTAATLWRAPKISHLGRAFGVVTLLALTTFTRTSHNLRMDIGFGIYGTLLLLCVLEAYRGQHDNPPQALSAGGRVWLGVGGLAFLLALETIPTMGLILGVCVGMAIIVRAFRWPLQQADWGAVLAYAGGAVVAVAAYILIHFAPDFAAKWAMFERHRVEWYAASGSTTFGAPLQALRGLGLFSLVLSPLELLAVLAAVVGLWWVGTRLERQLLIVLVATELLTATFIGGSYGYQVVFGAWVAYAAARIVDRRRGVLLVAVWAILPMLAAPMLHDMSSETQLDLNNRQIAELDLLTWQIPDGATVIGDDLFWLTLHDKANFIGHSGVAQYLVGYQVTREAMLQHADADVVICHEQLQAWLCELADAYFSNPPTPFTITNGTYWVYSR